MSVENHLLREARRLYRNAAERQTLADTTLAQARRYQEEAETLLRKAREHETAGNAMKGR